METRRRVSDSKFDDKEGSRRASSLCSDDLAGETSVSGRADRTSGAESGSERKLKASTAVQQAKGNPPNAGGATCNIRRSTYCTSGVGGGALIGYTPTVFFCFSRSLSKRGAFAPRTALLYPRAGQMVRIRVRIVLGLGRLAAVRLELS